MEKGKKKKCCSCLFNIFGKRAKVHSESQKEREGLGADAKYVQEIDLKTKRDLNLSPKLNSLELPGRPGHKTMIVNRDSFSSSFSNQDNERCIQTPAIPHLTPFSPLSEIRKSPLPAVFENTKSKSSKSGLPKLTPTTPNRSLKVKSNSLKS